MLCYDRGTAIRRADITDLVTPGAAATTDFDIRTFEGEEYENTNPGDLAPLE